MRKHANAIGLTLIVTAGLFGADNVLTPQEKAGGWVLLFDGKTLNGWTSVLPQGPGRGGGAGGSAGGSAGGGAARSGAAGQAKAAAQPGAAPAQGASPRPCSP